MLYLYRRKRIPLTSLVKGILLFNWSRREVTILAIRGPQPRVYPSTLLRGIL